MKWETLFIILFIASIISFTPLLEPAQEVTITPNFPNSIVFDAHTPSIKLSSNIESIFRVNVSYINLVKKTNTTIQSEIEFTSSLTIETDKPGYYLLEILSQDFSIIKIKGVGVYSVNLILFIILGVINAYYLYKRLSKVD
ncbi:MAG: hypothetical protein ACXAD7_27275 [Candidatus Kariarchaeaceae archaeon]